MGAMGKKRKFKSEVFGDVEASFSAGTWNVCASEGFLGYAEKNEYYDGWSACFIDGDASYTGVDFDGFHNGELGEQDVIFECDSLNDAIESIIYTCEVRRKIVQFVAKIGNCTPSYAWAESSTVSCYTNNGKEFYIKVDNRAEDKGFFILLREQKTEATFSDPEKAKHFIFGSQQSNP